AEDGIRDLTVTGVQTCALPISIWQLGSYIWVPPPENPQGLAQLYVRRLFVCKEKSAEFVEFRGACGKFRPRCPGTPNSSSAKARSEERRVGKECRARWSQVSVK